LNVFSRFTFSSLTVAETRQGGATRGCSTGEGQKDNRRGKPGLASAIFIYQEADFVELLQALALVKLSDLGLKTAKEARG